MDFFFFPSSLPGSRLVLPLGSRQRWVCGAQAKLSPSERLIATVTQSIDASAPPKQVAPCNARFKPGARPSSVLEVCRERWGTLTPQKSGVLLFWQACPLGICKASKGKLECDFLASVRSRAPCGVGWDPRKAVAHQPVLRPWVSNEGPSVSGETGPVRLCGLSRRAGREIGSLTCH